MLRMNRTACRCPRMLPALFLLAAVCSHEVSAAEGVVHVWSEFPPQGIEAVIGYPAWGYRFHPSYAMVDCDVDPEEALVILDGETLGEADDYDGFPSYLFIHPGQHQLEFRYEGRQLLVLRGSFLSGAFIRVDRELERGGEPMLVELGEPVDVGGGEQPPYQPPVLPPDDGPAGPVSPTTGPDSAAETREQAGDAGYLELQVTPADAAVYVDDRFFASGDEISRLHGYIRLSAGEHSIQVTRPGYRARNLVVDVIGGEKQHLDVWLEQAAPPGE
jgi:hypothetical protein